MATTSFSQLSQQTAQPQRSAQPSTPATRPKNNAASNFSVYVEKLKPQLARALPSHLSADRMCKLAMLQFNNNEQLRKCTEVSIAASLMSAAVLGLEVGVLGQGFLVPYRQKDGSFQCQFVPGWRGLSDLANRSGRSSVWTGCVHQGDNFDYQLGDSPFLRHQPGDESDPDSMTHVYAVGRVAGAAWPLIEVWSMNKIWRHRDKYNRQGDKHYSYRDPEMYARKVPLLQVLKYLPLSVELSAALAVAEAQDQGFSASVNSDGFVFLDEIANDPAPNPAAANPQPKQEAEKNTQASLGNDPGEVLTYAEVSGRIYAARTLDRLTAASEDIGAVADPKQRAELIEKYEQQRGKLTTQDGNQDF